MSSFNRTVRNTFITPDREHVFVNAPVGWNDIELSIKRGSKTDAHVLTISQNQEFIDQEKDFLIEELRTQGAGGTVEQKRERKVGNDWELIYSDFADLSSLSHNKVTATCDFRDNNFDKKFTDNLKEKFELDRTTALDGTDIGELTKYGYRHRLREILLRSEWELQESYSYNPVFINTTHTPKVTNIIYSDTDCASVVDDYVVTPTDGSNVSAANMIHLDASRPKTLDITISIDVDITTLNSNVARLFIYKYGNGSSFDYVEHHQLGADINSSGSVNINTTESITIDVAEGESLMFGLFSNLAAGYTIEFNSVQIVQTENSLVEPRNPNDLYYDCIPVKEAFERWVRILDPNVGFRSDFLDTKWPDLVMFSGETIRHVKYIDEENSTEREAPIATVSFEYLFEGLFTIEPCGYVIEQENGRNIVRLEEIGYFFDKEEAVELGALSNVEISVNKDKTFSSVEIGNKKSGENEEVYGLRATHTVNNYKLPLEDGDKVYKAVTDVRFDPTELELCFRKQASQFPDEDTRYDKDHFFVDAEKADINGITIYVSHEWQEHFTSVDGIYSKDTSYNYRLSPINCLLRHDFNFMQEYTKPVYANKSMTYTSTKGDVSLRTQLIGGALRAENGDIPMPDLSEPLYTNELIKGRASVDFTLFETITGGMDKKNYLKTFTWVNQNGDQETAYSKEAIINKDLQVELYDKV